MIGVNKRANRGSCLQPGVGVGEERVGLQDLNRGTFCIACEDEFGVIFSFS